MTKVTRPLIADTGELGKFIDGIKRKGAALDADIQLAGCSALQRVEDHGDIGYVNRLYLALPAGARKSAMTSWLLAYGSLSANDKDDKDVKPFIFSKDKATNVAGALADPWFDHKPDPDPDQVFDLAKMLKAVLKRAQAKAAKGSQVTHMHLLTQVQALLSAPDAPGPAGDDAPTEGGEG
jgi:hypothetical protein